MSRYCPPGADTSTETVIGPEGGDAELAGTSSTVGVPFRVRIPAGTLSEEKSVVLTETTIAPPDELFDVSPVYSVEADVAGFIGGAEISIPWTVPSGLVPAEIAVYFHPLSSLDGHWSRLGDSYTNAGFEQATIVYPGYYLAAYLKTDDLAACP